MIDAYVLLVFTVLACAAQGHLIPRIIGGQDAEDGAFPYQVSLRYSGSHLCGGSILDKHNILTAAHCCNRVVKLELLEVHAGTNKLDAPGEVYSVASMTVHKKHDPSLFFNDIALLHLASPIKFNQKVKAIKLTESNVDEGPCKLTGWGETALGGIPNNLQEIDLELYPYERCRNWYPGILRQRHICTQTKTGEGACHGDAGGPLVVNNRQVGIVSFGRPCGIGHPDVYTRVFSYRKWIKNNKKE